MTKTKRRITTVTLVLALGAAVFLNWEYAKIQAQSEPQTLPTATQVVEPESADSRVQEPLPDKNYGEAQLVSAAVDTGAYFDKARLTRTQTRDAALETLQKSLSKASLTQDEKSSLTAELSAAVSAITQESDIENLVMAKGFSDCMTYIQGNHVQVTVLCEGGTLSADQVSQIRDVVLSCVDTEAKNITVTEVQ